MAILIATAPFSGFESAPNRLAQAIESSCHAHGPKQAELKTGIVKPMLQASAKDALFLELSHHKLAADS